MTDESKKKAAELAKQGDVCRTCESQWTHQSMKPIRYQPVLDIDGLPVTTDEGTPIVACPFCDGELLFSLSKDVTIDD